jgi:hypothetical protein
MVIFKDQMPEGQRNTISAFVALVEWCRCEIIDTVATFVVCLWTITDVRQILIFGDAWPRVADEYIQAFAAVAGAPVDDE